MYECLMREHAVQPTVRLTFQEAIKDAKERKQKGLPTVDSVAVKRKIGKDEPAPTAQDVEDSIHLMLVSKTLDESRGHTSYLTFATFLPTVSAPSSPQEE
jgi:tRNA (adenine57-N1/adenine58-N1)-methyltransferase